MAKTMLTALALCAAASAHAAVGDYAEFFPSRDLGNRAVYGDLCNSGVTPHHVAYTRQWEECYLADWDAEEILEWMASHPLGAFERYRFTLNLCTAGWWEYSCGEGYVRYEIRTLNMPVDWVEGDGELCFMAGCREELNWSPNTLAATNAYAQARWYFDGFIPTLDPDNCIPWTAHDGTAVEAFQGSPSLFRHVNGVVEPGDYPGYLELDCGQILPDGNYGTWVSAELDYRPDHPAGEFPAPLVNDLLFNENNRGIVLGPAQAWDPVAEDWVPCEDCYGRFYSKDCDDPAFRPYLVVEIPTSPIAIPGDANHDWAVDGDDYTIWADNYEPHVTGKLWEQGDFTLDTIVDGSDYTIWADWYGYGTGGASVPAPGVLLLLAVAAAPALTRRRRR